MEKQLLESDFMNATDDTMDDNQTDCARYDYRYSKIAITVAVSTASVSFVACILVIILIYVLKKYRFLAQRLILYLTVAVMIKSLAYVVQTIHFEMVTQYDIASKTNNIFCILVAYFTLTTSWFELMAVASITTNLFLHAVATRSKGWLEMVYVPMIFIAPFLITWIPFVNDAYGKEGLLCWIRQRTANCERFIFGICLRFVLWYIPLLLILFILVVVYITISYTISKRNKKWDGNFDPMIRKRKLKMQKDVRPLIWYPLIYFLLHLIPLASHITDAITGTPFYPLWILSAITFPLQGGFIAFAFTLDIKTLRRLRRQKITGTVRGITQTRFVEDYPTEYESEEHWYGDSSSSSSSNENDEDREEGRSRRRGRYTEFTVPDVSRPGMPRPPQT